MNKATLGSVSAGTLREDHLLDSLTDELNGNAPANAYFGAHDGDGADFGFWPLTED